MDKRLNQIQALINQLASRNFDYKISPSESQDELDAVILGIITEAKQISIDLVKKNTELIQAQKEIGELSKFPSENPHPILRFNDKHKLLYHNAVSTINFLSDFKIKEDKLNELYNINFDKS